MNQIANSKRNSLSYLNLRFGIYLGFEIWDLAYSPLAEGICPDWVSTSITLQRSDRPGV